MVGVGAGAGQKTDRLGSTAWVVDSFAASGCILETSLAARGGPPVPLTLAALSRSCTHPDLFFFYSVSDPGPFVRIRIGLFSQVRIRIGKKIGIGSGSIINKAKNCKFKRKKFVLSLTTLSFFGQDSSTSNQRTSFRPH